MSYNSNLKDWDFPRIVITPNIEKDICELLGAEIASAYKSNQNEDSKKRIVRITEMLDFVRHMNAFTELLLKHEEKTEEKHGDKVWIKSHISFYGHDYSGFPFDAEAFKYYTLLSIIDVCSSQENNFEKIADYMKKSINDKDDITVDLVESVIYEHDEKYGLMRNFRKVFCELISEETRHLIADNLVVINCEKRTKEYSKEELNQIISSWMKMDLNDRCKKIANTLYAIRSSYTHANIRNFLPQPTPEKYISEKIDPKYFDNHILICRKNYKLTDILMTVVS